VALTFCTGVDVAHRFDNSRLVAAVFGLTPGCIVSGEVEVEVEQVGRITKCGNAMVRALLYEAANVMMTRCRTGNWLKSYQGRKAARGAQGEGSPGSASRRHNAPHVGRWNRLLYGKAGANDSP
jgi:transposase